MSEQTELKPGDVVMLKSGGPEMTIDTIDTFDMHGPGALCQWFDGKDLKTHVFSFHVLARPK